MDISLDIGDNLFNFRVGAIIKNKNKILVHHEKSKKHVTLIGGRIKSGEDSITALKREILEEIGADTEYVKSSSYVENFFEVKGKKYHEILIVHEMKFCDESMYQKEVFKSIEERKKDKLEFFWIDVNNFKDYLFLPQNLLKHLQNNIDEFEYILNDERIKSRKIKDKLYYNKKLWYNSQVAKMQYFVSIAFFLRERSYYGTKRKYTWNRKNR